MDWAKFCTDSLDPALWKEKVMQAYRFRARIVNDKDDMDRIVVDEYIMPRFLFDLSRNRDFIIMAATGNTPKGIWDLLVKTLNSNTELLEGFRKITYISQLDERLNIPKDSDHSFSNYILNLCSNAYAIKNNEGEKKDQQHKRSFKPIYSNPK